MPLFRRTPKPPPEIPIELPSGEHVDRGTRATLLQGKLALKGALWMTNRRLLFYAERGDARWMVVPFAEVRSAGLYPAPGMTMGAPLSRRQCLCVETAQGEQVWWDFGERDEREWIEDVRARAAAARDAAVSDASTD
ncbi:MAG TPA: hypothetical protein VFC53_01450 [Dehalococcoidia bacterium]|nr:hypothetical protein [Dehalococcoidia bacterium]